MVKVTKSRAPKETGGRDRDKDREMQEERARGRKSTQEVEKEQKLLGILSLGWVGKKRKDKSQIQQFV